MNDFQQEFVSSFLFKSLYKDEIPAALEKLGAKIPTYKCTDLEEEMRLLIKAVKEKNLPNVNPQTTEQFEEECRAMGFSDGQKKLCRIF